jgi:hypothetical protein
MVVAGTQPVQNVETYVEFDPTILRVVDAGGNPAATIEPDLAALSIMSSNDVDNSAGRIRYDAGQLISAPSQGTFRIATIRFQIIDAASRSIVQHIAPSGVFYRGCSVVGSLGSAHQSVSTTWVPLVFK